MLRAPDATARAARRTASLLALLAVSAALGAAAGVAVAARDWSAIRIGVDATYKPFTYKTPDGKLTGFDVDIATALCDEMHAKCSFVESSWEGIIPGLRANKFDAIVSSMSITDERRKAVDFTDKYYNTPSVVIARAGSGDGSPASLKGKRVGVLKASVQETYAKAVLSAAGATVVSYDSTQQAYVDLRSGRLDADVADKVEGRIGFLDTPDGKGFAIVGRDLDDPKYFGFGSGIAVRKSDPELRERLDAALKAIRADGRWQRIAARYFDFDVYGK